MYRFWRFLAQFFDRMAKKSSRGKARRDEYGRSARQRAFDYFGQGLRPSQLPDLGVSKTTIYRYHQAFKRGDREVKWRVIRRILMDPAHLQEASRVLGISEQKLAEALKRARSAAQLRKMVGLEEAERLQRLVEEAQQLDLDRIIHGLRACHDFPERRAKLQEEAKRLGMSEAELILALAERTRQLRADAVLRKVIRGDQTF